jgi:hypothetical protein
VYIVCAAYGKINANGQRYCGYTRYYAPLPHNEIVLQKHLTCHTFRSTVIT